MQTDQDSAVPHAYALDLPSLPFGTLVCITGFVSWSKEYTDQGLVSMGVRDITGIVPVKIPAAKISADFPVRKNTRIRVLGKIAHNHSGNCILSDVESVTVLGDLNTKLADLDGEMKEQASRLLLSRICRIATDFLRDSNFIEVDTKVISTEWADEGLEPLQILYPGFGKPAVLATSPSAQLAEFLNVTGAMRVFTVSTSFTTTYRHPNCAAESRVICAKLTNSEIAQTKGLLINLASKCLDRLGLPPLNPLPELSRSWTESHRFKVEGMMALVEYTAGIPIKGSRWDAEISMVMQLVASDGSILAEVTFENYGTEKISSLTIYPAQFITLLTATQPRRQLRNLGKYNEWLA